MILRGDTLQGRFKDLLETNTRVDIATAWATGGEHLRVLADATKQKRRGLKVRAIVGITGNATRPDALEELNRITGGDLRIVGGDGGRLFHAKLYLFGRHIDGFVTHHAWVGSANFTNMGFGGNAKANEELVLEVGPGEGADALAAWFQERWDGCRTDSPASEVIRQYKKYWKPPYPDVQQIVSGLVSHRIELLDDAHRPLTIKAYQEALKTCEGMLQDEEWEILNPQRRSYMRVIDSRRKLLLGKTSWSQLDRDSQTQLKGSSASRTESEWWGLMGRMGRRHWPAVLDHETQIRALLDTVVRANDSEFPDIAVSAMRELTDIEHMGSGTATLLLTLARPDRLLSLNSASEKGLSNLSGKSRSTLGKPANYHKLLRWLYDQPWYAGPPPANEDLVPVWRFRAALVDAFVYERT